MKQKFPEGKDKQFCCTKLTFKYVDEILLCNHSDKRILLSITFCWVMLFVFCARLF